MSNEDMEDALTDLQMRLTYQDDEIRNLNLAVERQRSELDTLKAEVDRLKNLVAALAPAQADGQQDETPPHF
jgi:SlyX protein